MVNWNCSSSLCFNSYKTVDKNGNKIKFYRLPSADKDIQKEYQRVFRTTSFNWKHGYICGEHWSTGERPNSSSIPDVLVTPECFKKIKLKLERAKKRTRLL